MKGLLAALLLLTCMTAAGQTRNLEISSGSEYTSPDEGLRSFGSSITFLSYRNEAFINNTYHQFKEAKYIGGNYGIELSYQMLLFGPLALEATGFYTMYNAEAIATGDVKNIWHGGLELFANVYPMPYLGKISEIVAPFAGIGYQSSSLSWGDNISAGTSSAMFKVGIMLNLSSMLSLRGEYKQTLPTSSNKLFRVLDFGLGIHF